MTRIGPALALIAMVVEINRDLILLAISSVPFLAALPWSELRALPLRPESISWQARHPQITKFAVGRLDASRFSGRTLSLLALAMASVLWDYTAFAPDLLMSDPIIQADTRLAALIDAFQTPGAIRFDTYVTASGVWRGLLHCSCWLGSGGCRRFGDVVFAQGSLRASAAGVCQFP